MLIKQLVIVGLNAHLFADICKRKRQGTQEIMLATIQSSFMAHLTQYYDVNVPRCIVASSLMR